MNAKEQLGEFKKLVDIELDKYLKLETEKAAKISPFCKELMKNITEITMRGGKRIRAALFYYSYLAHGGQDKERIMQACLSMELMQTFLLIHDDIIDNDSMRRGGKTIHKVYENIGDERFPQADSTHFGISTAILAGDLAHTLSNEIILSSGFDSDNVHRAMVEFSKMYIEEYYGEFLDVLSELRDDIKKEDVILTHRLKTAPYTFDGPIKIGAFLAGATEAEVLKLDEYTIPLGIAFQVQDDILGMFGEEDKLGKPNTSDLKEGKNTLLILDSLEKADEKQKAIIKSNLGNREAGAEELEAVREVIRQTGAYDSSVALAKDYVTKAKEAISSLDLAPEGKDFIYGIAEYMVNRDY